ncbi:unnamed protein product [Caenorhabditis sp. 36 PRJEB53466]|nr:unnamed protein product [Caenorhabditis sp. 36 PRJEB53466]
MWQSQPQPIRFNQYGNNYYNVLETTTLNPNPNASIDFVVTQVEKLANQINTLTADGETAGLQIADRGVQTFNRMKDAFNNGTIPNVDRIVDIVKQKTHDWPVTELIVMVIVGLVLVVITLIFLFLLFGERVTEYRFRKKLSAESDIENI